MPIIFQQDDTLLHFCIRSLQHHTGTKTGKQGSIMWCSVKSPNHSKLQFSGGHMELKIHYLEHLQERITATTETSTSSTTRTVWLVTN